LVSSEIHIWRSFLIGDKLSLEQLMKVHYKTLYNFGVKYTTDFELVKDCIQELFLGLWDRRTHLSNNVNPKAYLLASLRRILHRKVQAQNRVVKRNTIAHDFSEYFNFEITIEQKMISDENVLRMSKKISEAIVSLPKRQKEVIYLKFFQNLSRDEIAEIMGNTPQTISNLMQLALKRMRLDLNGVLSALAAIIILFIL
jgi:RNA polymerase sigma factor (sigma-70 family)